MSRPRDVEVSVDDLMLEIHEEVARRRAGRRQSRFPSAGAHSVALEQRDLYSLADFLRFHDADFVRNAYLGILRREPDPAGAADYRSGLRSGRRSKADVIKALRFSPEGKAVAVHIIGLREGSSFAVEGIPNLRMSAPGGRIAPKNRYSVADFMSLHDEAFVHNAYLCILRRKPDPRGFAEFLGGLRTGRVSRIEILGALRYSAEGKAAGVAVRGLAVRYGMRRLHRIPVIGRAIAIGQYAVRLPDLVRHHERLEAAVFHLRAETADAVEALSRHVQASVRELESDLEGLSGEMAIREQVTAMHERLGRLTAELEDVSARHDALASLARVDELAEELETIRGHAITRQEQAHALAELNAMHEHLGHLTAELGDVSARQDALASVARVEELAKELETTQRHAITRQEQAHALADLERRIESGRAEVDHGLDDFYASFEDRFRGTEEEIRQRVEVYLPIVRGVGGGGPGALVLDVGCGRGEWLELLRDSGLTARGVDLNQSMIERCRRRGLDVIEGDAIEYLRTLEGASLGAVTGMHVIEHMPFPRLIELLDETLRVLRPGGVAIFETPNPENLRVGACNFHFDPTHIRPLPPESTKFVVEARGFARVEILRLHPDLSQPQLREGENALHEVVDQALFGPQDYAIVAYKAEQPVTTTSIVAAVPDETEEDSGRTSAPN